MESLEYDLSLDIDFYSLSVRGNETIRFKDNQKDINLDVFELKIKSVKINGKDLSYEHNVDTRKLKISEANAREISIEYETKVSEKMLYGIYKSRFDDNYFVTTDFEPNGARMLFPCIDHPSYKAIFSLKVTTQTGLMVISNTAVEGIVDLGERSKHIFKKTPKMPTYVLYLGIGKFEEESIKDGNIKFRVLARPGYAKKGRFALESAVKFLRAYEDYYSIPYPLDKLDLIALPEYASGAMENWGAISFREVGLLVDKGTSAANKRQATANLGHEIAHMWFGDLVTMRWWNDLWLNESFATFMEYKMANKLFPNWNLIADFIQQTSTAMHNDSLSNTHPIDERVSDPEEISEIFDEISYGKGASVLRMTEAWLGHDAFRRGVSSYLLENKYGNAEGADLWRSLQKSSGQPVTEVLETWIKRPGFPLVRVSHQQGRLTFSQEKFLLRQRSNEKDLWPIPINFRLNDKDQTLVLKDQTLEIPVSKIESLKVNSEQVGFYRTLYDKTLYSAIEGELQTLGPIDRWGIITDLFEFLEGGLVEKDQYFSIIRKCFHEKEYIVANAIRSELYFLRYLLPENAEVGRLYTDYHKAQLGRLGVESRKEEDDTDKILRGELASGLAIVDRDFARELAPKFNEYEKLDANIRAAVAKSFAQINGADAYDPLISTMKRLGSEADVVKIYTALASFKDPKLVSRVLDFCISGEISRADSLYAIFYANENPYARETTWSWLKQNIRAFRDLFHGTPYIAMIMQDTISRAGVDRENEVRQDLRNMEVPEADKGIKKGLELLDIYSNLKARLESKS